MLFNAIFVIIFDMKTVKIPKIVKASQLKHEYASIVDGIKSGEQFIVTHPDVDSVILSVEKFNSLLEEIEDLKNALEAEQEYQEGDTVSLEQASKEIYKMLGKKDESHSLKESQQKFAKNRKSRTA
ncbi:MAG: type II toxin-antitoxin system Phd/YefM family antitoxin [Pseudobdellovibrionaceae bacterium]